MCRFRTTPNHLAGYGDIVENELTLNPDGTITLGIDDITRQLRRPNLGEYRLLMEAYGKIRDDITDFVANPGDEENTESEQVTNRNLVTVAVRVVVEWLDLVSVTLAGEGLPRVELDAGKSVVDESKLEAWLVNTGTIAEVIAHWQTRPSRRGGR